MRLSKMSLLAIFMIGCITLPVLSFAQVYDTQSIFKEPIELDSFVVKSGFDVNAFIKRMQNDTTFYKAFRAMRLQPFQAVSTFTAFDKKGRETASLYLRSRQEISKRKCRKSVITEKTVKGDFFKSNGEPAYYTADLFFNLFFTEKEVCNENDIVAREVRKQTESRLEKNKQELKQLIFNPGSKIQGVPFMGDRASVFDEDEAHKYDFKIVQDNFDGQPCYRFSIIPKPNYAYKVVFSELITWFHKSDYSIIARNYNLSFSTVVYNFDVKMKVTTTVHGGKLLPAHIAYDGKWHVVTKKPERMKVVMDVQY